jgi:hypothetical protein
MHGSLCTPLNLTRQLMKKVNPLDASEPPISEAQDARNKLFLSRSLVSAITRDGSLTAKQRWLIEEASPHDRQFYAVMKLARYGVMAAFVCSYLLWLAMQPAVSVPPPSTVITEAGTVKEIRLHETTFSTSSTVTTSNGIYQVRGGVSAATGDAVRIESQEGGQYPPAKKSLCVKSTIKTACYPLL